MTLDLKHFKDLLEKEQKTLEKELGEIGRRNPDNPTDWEAKAGDRDVSQADDNTVADSIEDYEENMAIVSTLETRYKDVVDALEKMKNDKYGLCEVSGEPIELERLEANPAARTCLTHMK